MSRALSAPEKVSGDTRAKVSEAVEATGYTINQAARSLRMREARTILVAIPNMGNPFYSTIMDAVVGEAAERGYGVLVANRLGNDPTQWLRDYFSSNRADGLLLFDASLELGHLPEPPRQRGALPLVLSCDEIIDGGFNLVTTDNRAAAERATRHLIELGHTRIGQIGGRQVHQFPNERTLGFQDAMRKAGLPTRPDWYFPGDHTMACGIRAADSYLALEDRPTALFCANDESMIGFLSRSRAHGIECPRDISLIGFDDINIAENYWPPLTTMRQPRHELGRVATATLLDILDGTTRPNQGLHVILPSQLIIRGSTAACSSHRKAVGQ